MTAPETRRTQVSLFGRVADELTRSDLPPRRFRAVIAGQGRVGVLKQDGYFAIPDLTPSPPAHLVELGGPEFQPRTVSAAWPGPGAVEMVGDDELHVIVTSVAPNRISFARVGFVPRIASGSAVIGEAGFTTTLTQDLEGVDVENADLQTAPASLTGTVLRIVRSRRFLLRPGPLYPFPAGTTVAAVRVVDVGSRAPLSGAQVVQTQLNGVAIASAAAGGVTLFRADLPGTPPPALPPPIPYMIGPDSARQALTGVRGDAVFYFPQTTPLTSMTVDVSRPGYVTQARALTIQPGARTFDLVQLVRT